MKYIFVIIGMGICTILVGTYVYNTLNPYIDSTVSWDEKIRETKIILAISIPLIALFWFGSQFKG